MIKIEFSIWMATKDKWVHLLKSIHLPCVPRVGEFMKFHSDSLGDYFAWQVSEVTYRESGKVEVWTELLDNVDDRMYSFEDDAEFEECLAAYLSEGWSAPRGVTSNKRYVAKIHNKANHQG
ncbi:hypothetical protein [Photobacterium nomapromontoriensis]|uniref:hypothetical protein n=1 Tax=Photobacterium nomapromontoriensis TaxID=2910237 RepID=UPI003D0FD777